MTQETQEKIPKNWKTFVDGEALAQGLVAEMLELADKAIQQNGAFHFVTAGGSTPNRCYQLLSHKAADWKSWHIYMGDERVLPIDDAERNSQALLKHWLALSPIPAQNIHFMNTELGAEKSAQQYADLIQSVPSFDLCLLGMGEDGHTASLFPGHEHSASVKSILPGLVTSQLASKNDLNEAPVIIETNSPKLPSQRVSLSYSAFKKCQLVIKLITGKGKQAAVKTWITQQSELPIQKVEGKRTKVYISQDALVAPVVSE